MKPDLNPEMEELIKNISTKNMYQGNKIPKSIMDMFEIREDAFSIAIYVPYWLSILEKGRGPRKSKKSSDLYLKIYAWMRKKNMFKSKTTKGRINEAKALTWYINKYGNTHFRSKVFIDVYTSERKDTIKKIEEKFSDEVLRITMDVL
jgi:hypothetical protein